MQRAIRLLKYNGRRSLASILGGMMAELAESSKVLSNRRFDMIVPVPLHPWRMLEREFNQSELLGHELAARLKVPLETNLLTKVRKTRPQVGLSPQQRRDNLKGAFAVNPRLSLKAKTILLVDDVMTTGATGDECASTLLAAGAQAVYVITAAREV
jgi:competence protein ComFC